MLKNESAKWAVSDVLIEKLVKFEFGVYVERIGNQINVFFLPKNSADIIPEVDRELFVEWYNFYAKRLGAEIRLNEILDGFMGALLDDANEYDTLQRIKRRIALSIDNFDLTNKHRITAKQMLLHTFNIYGK